MAVWVSSSAPGMTLKAPASHSFSTSSTPASIFLNSSSVRRSAFVFARAKAMEPRMSYLWRTLSKDRDSFVLLHEGVEAACLVEGMTVSLAGLLGTKFGGKWVVECQSIPEDAAWTPVGLNCPETKVS